MARRKQEKLRRMRLPLASLVMVALAQLARRGHAEDDREEGRHQDDAVAARELPLRQELGSLGEELGMRMGALVLGLGMCAAAMAT